ncbi:Crp/Fnr family transcriptional regulator [Sphingomonas sp. R86521]|uniref:Crp/Fnr family transcriptional regulator n=1 Tax=Sphingomonas sp. R86521 TaxID=3093860 RepID=UPI0036D2C59A
MAKKLASWAETDLYWSEFDDTDKAAVLDLPHRTKRIERHGYIVREGEETVHSCVILSGYAIRHKIVDGGARQILSVHMRGDIVDLQNSFLGLADHNVQMLTGSEIAFIPRQAIRKLAFERPNVGMAMWHDSLVDGSIFREWMANVGRRDAQTRVAHLLCEFSLRLKLAGLGSQTDYELPMTQEQLADCVGLTPVHVNRTLKMLEIKNLIVRTRNRGIVIADWRKLADAGDFDSNYLHVRGNPALS